MDSSSGSFIPNNPVKKGGPKRRVRRIYVVSYIIYIFFTVTVLVAIGLWLYTRLLTGQLIAAQEQLAAEQQRFAVEDFDQIRELDHRLQQVNTIFNNQISTAQLFTGIEDVLLSFAEVEAFEFSNDASAVRVTLSTSLPDFNAALFQRQVLEQHELFGEAVIENIVYGVQESDEGVSAEAIISYDIVASINRENLQDFTSTLTSTRSSNGDEAMEFVEDESNEELLSDDPGASIDGAGTDDILLDDTDIE